MSVCGTGMSETPYEAFLGSVIRPLRHLAATRIQVSAIPVDLLAGKGLRL